MMSTGHQEESTEVEMNTQTESQVMEAEGTFCTLRMWARWGKTFQNDKGYI